MILFAPSGPQFIALYVGLLVVALVVAGILRHSLRTPSGDPGAVTLVDPYEVAYLTGGDRTAADAAIVTLASRNAITCTPHERFEVGAPQPVEMDALELAIHRAVAARAGRSVRPRWAGVTAAALRTAARPALRQLRARLEGPGLVMTRAQQARSRVLPTLVVVAIGAVGLVRLIHGAMVGHPTGYLTLLLLTTGVVALLFLGIGTPRSLRGDALLTRLRSGNAALRSSIGMVAGAGAGGPDLTLAVALWGPTVLTGTDLAILGRALTPGTSGGGGGAGGGGGCGGGGGGCGGS